MAAIDVYIGYLSKFQASAIILESGKQILVRLPSGDRAATQTLSLAALQGMIEEIGPPNAQADLLVNGTATFDYARGPQPVRCLVTSSPTVMRVVIAVPDANAPALQTRAATEPATPSAPAATPAVSAPATPAAATPAAAPAAVASPHVTGGGAKVRRDAARDEGDGRLGSPHVVHDAAARSQGRRDEAGPRVSGADAGVDAGAVGDGVYAARKP